MNIKHHFRPGTIAYAPFPFTDTTSFKWRPVIIVAVGSGSDYIVVPIDTTSKSDRDIPFSRTDTVDLLLFDGFIQYDKIARIEENTMIAIDMLLFNQFQFLRTRILALFEHQ